MNTTEFLQHLYGEARGWLEIHGRFEGNGRTARPFIIPLWFYLPDDYDDLEYILEHDINVFSAMNADGYGLHRSMGLHKHFPPGVLCERCNKVHDVRPCDSSVAVIPALVADFDDMTADDAIAILDTFEHVATVLVESGGGLHAYWRLDKPLDVSGEDGKHHYRSLVKGLARYLETNDESVASISQTMRLPGFINRKPKRNGAPCRVIWHSDNTYSVDQFQAYALELKTWQRMELPALPADLRGQLPNFVNDYVQTGARQGERNHTLFVAARFYNDNGYNVADAERDLLPRATADGLTEHEARHTIASAFKYPGGTPNLSRRVLAAYAARGAMGE